MNKNQKRQSWWKTLFSLEDNNNRKDLDVR